MAERIREIAKTQLSVAPKRRRVKGGGAVQTRPTTPVQKRKRDIFEQSAVLQDLIARGSIDPAKLAKLRGYQNSLAVAEHPEGATKAIDNPVANPSNVGKGFLQRSCFREHPPTTSSYLQKRTIEEVEDAGRSVSARR